MFIVIEGIDGCGKGVQAELALQYLNDTFKNEKSSVMKYPARNTPVGQLIDQWLKGQITLGERNPQTTHMTGLLKMVSDTHAAVALQGLMLANKVEVQGELRKRLQEGHVIADRYTPSGEAYGIADGLDPGWLAITHRELVKPDLVILLDIPVSESFKRRLKGREHFEQSITRLSAARSAYLNLAKKYEYLVLDGLCEEGSISLQISDSINSLYERSL